MDPLRRSFSCAVMGLAIAASAMLAGCDTVPSPGVTAIPGTPGATLGPTANTSPPVDGPSAGPPETPPSGPGVVIDRKGVPAEMYGLFWNTSNGYAGSVGTTAQTHVPDEEYIVAVGPGREKPEGYVVSVLERADGPDVRAEILVRIIGSDDVLFRTDTELTRVQALLVFLDGFGPRLFWTGLSGLGIAPDGVSLTDGGIYSADLEQGFDDIRTIVKPGTPLDAFGDVVDHGTLAIDPSGRFVLSRVGGFDATRTTVVDALELFPREPAFDFNGVIVAQSAAVSGAVAINYAEGHGLPYLEAVIATGDEAGTVLWRFPGGGEGYELFDVEELIPLDGAVVVGYQRAGEGFNEWAVTTIDLASGKPRDLFAQRSDDDSILHLARRLSAGPWLALTPDFWEASILAGDAISLLPTEGGEPVRDAFRITIQ